jgi:hypothetical protein
VGAFVTIARSGPTDPVTHAETPGGSARPSPYHVPHEFLLLSRDLPGRHDVVADALRPIVGHRRQCATSIVGVYLNPGSAPGIDAGWAQVYRGVNERFADTAGRVAATGGVVLVVGHQLQLVPAMLRRRRPDLLVAFFLELPLPSAEVLRPTPIRRELVTGALGADLIGFQSPESADNFRRMALSDADVRLGSGGLEGRRPSSRGAPRRRRPEPGWRWSTRPNTSHGRRPRTATATCSPSDDLSVAYPPGAAVTAPERRSFCQRRRRPVRAVIAERSSTRYMICRYTSC